MCLTGRLLLKVKCVIYSLAKALSSLEGATQTPDHSRRRHILCLLQTPPGRRFTCLEHQGNTDDK